MNVLLMLAHSIEEHDQVRLLSELGYDVFSLGGYIDPVHPHDPKRPALPNASRHPELQAVVDGLGQPDNLDAAKRRIPDDILDWADVIVCHHLEHTWIAGQWDRIKHKRVIWRTVGQSAEGNEAIMAPLRKQGLEIVRYSPKERNIPGYVGEDALIRFYKDPDEWTGWNGEWLLGENQHGPIVGAEEGEPFVVNVSQHDARPHARDSWLNWGFWEAATKGLPRTFAGPHSELVGGLGALSLDQMQRLLRGARAYLYTGTQPASYTLGLIEAMMTGIPVVSIAPSWMTIFPYGPDLFEGLEITGFGPTGSGAGSVQTAHDIIAKLLRDPEEAARYSQRHRQRAIDLFGMDAIGKQWLAYLGTPAEKRAVA